VTYAGKAFLCLAMAQWTQQQGLWVDCSGQGEIGIAAAGGVKPEHLLVHGVNKSPQDLKAACRYGGAIVVDHLEELEALISMAAEASIPEVWLRFQPGVEVDTHTHIQTGQAGSKFGMERQDLERAAGLLRRSGRPLKGLHFHLGSQIRQAAPVGEAIRRTLEAAAGIGMTGNWTLSPGGGWGVAYNENELPLPETRDYVQLVAREVTEGCRRGGLPLPRLQLEPGRSLAARAGVAVYRAGAVKHSGGRTWVLMDGGLADNPRQALYGVNYSALVVDRPNAPPEERVCLAGPYCESGDVLSMDLPMPSVKAGELIAVPVSGAYQLSMSSNYNGACRPAVLWVKEGKAQLIQERERPADLLRRNKPLGGATQK
jgi:diaminopimelate decarboxylase